MLLSQLNTEFDYTKMEDVDRVYIPLRCFRNVKNKNIKKTITTKLNNYIYLPTFIKLY